jgi:hypothetical protein
MMQKAYKSNLLQFFIFIKVGSYIFKGGFFLYLLFHNPWVNI